MGPGRARLIPFLVATVAALAAVALPLAMELDGTFPTGFYLRETLFAGACVVGAGAAVIASGRGPRVAALAMLVLAGFFLGEAVGFDDGMAYVGQPSAVRYVALPSGNLLAAVALAVGMAAVAWRVGQDASDRG